MLEWLVTPPSKGQCGFYSVRFLPEAFDVMLRPQKKRIDQRVSGAWDWRLYLRVPSPMLCDLEDLVYVNNKVQPLICRGRYSSL